MNFLLSSILSLAITRDGKYIFSVSQGKHFTGYFKYCLFITALNSTRSKLSEMSLKLYRCVMFTYSPFCDKVLMIGYVGASRAERAPSPSGFSHPYSVEAPLYLWKSLRSFSMCSILPIGTKG